MQRPSRKGSNRHCRKDGSKDELWCHPCGDDRLLLGRDRVRLDDGLDRLHESLSGGLEPARNKEETK